MTQNINDILFIDKNSLDVELIRQAQTYYLIAEDYAEAASRRDAAYEAIKQVDAEAYFQLRTQYDSEGVKITEALLGQKVLTHPNHLKAHADHNVLKLEADKLAALKDAFGQRAYMLRDLVQLHTTGYFTENSISGKETVASDIAYINNRSRLVTKRNEDNAAIKEVTVTVVKEEKSPMSSRTLRR